MEPPIPEPMIATSTVSGKSLIRPTGGAHVAHCISNSSGRQIERVSRNERPLWADLGQPIVGAGTAGIGATSPSGRVLVKGPSG